MNIFIDTEAMRFVTEKELRQEFEQLKREQPEEYAYTFEQYVQNCTSKNGTLEEACMTYHMGAYLLISVANYIGYLEGKGLIEIEDEGQLYSIMEEVDEDVNAAAELKNEPFDFWTEVDKSLKRQGVLKDAK